MSRIYFCELIYYKQLVNLLPTVKKRFQRLKFMSNQNMATILLAEDDEFISRAYRDGLGRAGYRVLTASDGNKALDLAEKEIPDLILLDLIMPEKNGFEVLKEIKANDKLKRIPVIIVSNLGQETDIHKGRELGAVDYLIKSDYSMAEVVEKIKKYLKKDGRGPADAADNESEAAVRK